MRKANGKASRHYYEHPRHDLMHEKWYTSRSILVQAFTEDQHDLA